MNTLRKNHTGCKADEENTEKEKIERGTSLSGTPELSSYLFVTEMLILPATIFLGHERTF